MTNQHDITARMQRSLERLTESFVRLDRTVTRADPHLTDIFEHAGKSISDTFARFDRAIGRIAQTPRDPNQIAGSTGRSLAGGAAPDPFRVITQVMQSLNGATAPSTRQVQQFSQSIARVVVPVTGATASLRGLGSTSHQLGLSVGLAIGLLTRSIGLVPAAVAQAGNTVNSITGTITGSFGRIEAAVAKANPAAAARFALALDDLIAVLGHALAPLLDIGTALTRQIADTLATMRPAIDAVIQPIGRMAMTLSQLITPAAEVLTPILALLGAVLQSLEPVMHMLVDAAVSLGKGLANVVHLIIGLYNELADSGLFGLQKVNLAIANFNDLARKSSYGASVRPTGYTSLEDYGKKARTAALGSGVSPETRELQKANQYLQTIAQGSQTVGHGNVGDDLNNLADKVARLTRLWSGGLIR